MADASGISAGGEPARRIGGAHDEIVRTAYRLFIDVGYEKATYALIAERSGFERTLVQYHLPRKADLAAHFLTDVLRISERVLADLRLADSDEPMGYRYVLAQVYYAVLSAPALRGFAVEALDRRSIVSQVLDRDIEWNLQLVRPDQERRQALIDDSIMAVGGAYELLAHRLRAGRDAEPADLAARTLLGAVRCETAERLPTEDTLAAHTLPPDRREDAARRVIAALRDDAGD